MDLDQWECVPGGDGGRGVGPVHPAGGGGGTLALRPALTRPAVEKDREARGLGVWQQDSEGKLEFGLHFQPLSEAFKLFDGVV